MARPDLPRRQEQQALLALTLAAFVLNLNTNVLGALRPFLPGVAVPRHDSFGWLLSAAAFGSAGGALVFGPLADRVGRRLPLLVGMAVFVLASALHLLVAGFVPLLVLRAVSGIAVGVAYSSASALTAELVPYARRGRAMGLFSAGMFLAIPVGLPVAVLFASEHWWQGVFGVQALFGAAGLWLALRAVPRDGGGAHTWVAPWRMLGRPPVAATLAAVLLHVGSFFGTVQLATKWLDQPQLVPKDQQGTVWIALGLASALGSLFFGRIADRVGKRAFVLLTSAVLVGCFILLARSGAVQDGRAANGQGLWLLALIGSLLAVTAAARTGPLQALTSGLVAERELGTLMGLRAFFMQLGVGLFVQLVALLRQDDGFAVVLWAAAACQGASYLLIRAFVQERR